VFCDIHENEEKVKTCRGWVNINDYILAVRQIVAVRTDLSQSFPFVNIRTCAMSSQTTRKSEPQILGWRKLRIFDDHFQTRFTFERVEKFG